MIATLYQYLTELGAPLIRYYLRRRMAAGREDTERFNERLGETLLPRPAGFLIWCHAASVGEAASLMALIEKLRERYPAAALLMTTGTVTSARMLEGRLPEGVLHQYMPVDRLPYVQSFLDHWHPELVLWVESELWPNMLGEVRQRKIPAVLLNGRMSQKSFAQWLWARSWARDILGAFSLCLAQTEAERERFIKLGATSVHCVGNLKYAAQPLDCTLLDLENFNAATQGREMWAMVSTHRGEEEMAAELHKQLRRARPSLLTIIAPRHPVRGDEIAHLLKAQGLQVARRSKAEIVSPSVDVYLADSIGELGLFFRLSPIVVMGGSFTWRGHNPIEPAQLGCALVFGPSMSSFSEITREFLLRRAAIQIGRPDELSATVNRLMSNPAERDLLISNARRLAADKQHVLDDVLHELEPWLPPRVIQAPQQASSA